MKVTITIEIEDEKIEKTKTDVAKEKSEDNLSQYARFFDEGCPGWTKDPEYNLVFLKNQQDYCNNMLKAKRHLLLNDVYDILGIPRTKSGAIVGWIYDEKNPIGDNFVAFEIFNDRNTDFINGYKPTVLLDFNVDGNILDYLEEES